MVVVGGLEQFSVSPRPLGFGFGAKGLGPGLDNIFILARSRTALVVTVATIEQLTMGVGFFLVSR